ncbi:uncharacterized protein B0H18DRAFT_486038 [Fomitopsis serialis]|uniref:uncharacterized protein n=1 Tax=Fomitopsis serialis TaxID=139415 RepID=UPI0020074951|nr:uncharacterized protein B0H18DRAFT_486038 [Neoantrodia serialis]KAH9934733.1 hypothetical protein B0H18DRAFT_486038 [Neoantrodia serialis]
MRSCRSNLSPPHSVSYLSSLYCLGCHYSSCLMHLLDTGIHASEVFLAIHKDLGKADYSQLHQTHLHAKTQFGNVKPALTGVEKTGVFAPQAARLGARLVLAAQRFRHCRAVNSVFTSPGFYDYEVSPREPVDAPAPDCNAPENTKHENAMDISRSQTPALGSPRAQSPEIPLRHSLAQIEESSPADGVMSQEHFAQTHIDDARFDTLTAARSVTEPPQRHNRAYILLSGPASGSSKRKRDAAATSEQTSRRKRVKASKPQEEDFVDDDYGGALVNVMQSAYNQAQDSQRPGPNKFKRVARRVDSPDPEPEDPIPRGRRDDPQGSRLPSARPRQRSGRDLVDPDRETMRSASKKAKPKSRRPEPCPEPTTGTASQQLTSARDNPIAQSSKASTTGNRALIRAPRGKPPGMPASDCDALPQTTHTHRSTPRTHAGRGRDQTHLDSTEPLSELRAQLRQSEAKRIRLEEDKSRIEDKLAESVHDLTTSRSDYDKLHSECDKFRSERDKFRSERDKFRLERDKYRLECDKLRSECDKLRSERDMDNHRYSDHRKEVGHYKAMSELVEGKLHNAQEALKSKDRQIEDQRRDVEGYKEGLQYLANEFETYLRSHGALQHPSGVPDHMQPMYHQLRQFTDLIGGLITKATQRLPIGSFSEAQPLFLVGNQHGVNTSSPGIVIQSQRVCWAR